MYIHQPVTSFKIFLCMVNSIPSAMKEVDLLSSDWIFVSMYVYYMCACIRIKLLLKSHFHETQTEILISFLINTKLLLLYISTKANINQNLRWCQNFFISSRCNCVRYPSLAFIRSRVAFIGTLNTRFIVSPWH